MATSLLPPREGGLPPGVRQEALPPMEPPTPQQLQQGQECQRRQEMMAPSRKRHRASTDGILCPSSHVFFPVSFSIPPLSLFPPRSLSLLSQEEHIHQGSVPSRNAHAVMGSKTNYLQTDIL